MSVAHERRAAARDDAVELGLETRTCDRYSLAVKYVPSSCTTSSLPAELGLTEGAMEEDHRRRTATPPNPPPPGERAARPWSRSLNRAGLRRSRGPLGLGGVSSGGARGGDDDEI